MKSGSGQAKPPLYEAPPYVWLHLSLHAGQDPQPSTQGDIAGPTDDSEIGDSRSSILQGGRRLLWVGLLVLIFKKIEFK